MNWPVIGTWTETGEIQYFTTWKEIFDVNFRNDDGSPKPPPSWAGYYGDEMHVLMVLARQAGLPAAAALAWVDYEAGGGTMIGSLNARAAYALLDAPPAGDGTSVAPVVHAPADGLKAASANGVLLITGLVPGERFRIYNLQGQLVRHGKATATEARILLRERGVYIVTAGNRVAKAVY
jgi:hypothetical protein